MSIDNITTGTAAKADALLKKPATRPVDETQITNPAEVAAFKVNISPIAEQLLKAAPTEEEIRRDKVAAIRDQLASGSYSISGKDVASKILNALKN